MSIKVTLHYMREKDDGLQIEIPTPDNYPDAITFDGDSLENLSQNVQLAMIADSEVHGAPPLPDDVSVTYVIVEPAQSDTVH